MSRNSTTSEATKATVSRHPAHQHQLGLPEDANICKQTSVGNSAVAPVQQKKRMPGNNGKSTSGKILGKRRHKKVKIKTGIGADNMQMENLFLLGVNKQKSETSHKAQAVDSVETSDKPITQTSELESYLKRRKDSESSSSLEEAEIIGNCTANMRLQDLKQQKLDNDCNTHDKLLSRVLVICTGGTLTMVHTPRGYMAQKGFINRLKVYSNLYDREYSQEMAVAEDECVTPVTPFGTRILYKVVEFEELLDSSNLTLQHQIQIAQMIHKDYYNYDAFVVLHGTDTIAYTASSLSFMLENLNKPVILTGSQIPILELKNDAVDNFLGALLVAGQYQIPEVCIFFGNKLLRGNRTSKMSTSRIVAFETANMAPLGEVGVNFKINWSLVNRYNFEGKLQVFTEMSDEISMINITPCLNLRVVENILQSCKAVVLQAYGMGNIPTSNEKLMSLLSCAIRNDVIIVIMSQCKDGGVNDLYETGRALVDIGAVLAFDMTVECVIAKLSYLIGKGYSIPKVKKMVMQSLRGEMTDLKKTSNQFSLKNNEMVKAVKNILNVTDQEDMQQISNTVMSLLINSVACSDNMRLMAQLADEGANFNSSDYRGRSPLHIATLNGNYEVVKFLLDQSVNMDQVDNSGTSALFYACTCKQHRIVDLFVERGATVIVQDTRLVQELCQAAHDGDLDLIKLLSRSEANLNGQNYDGRTIGHLAVCENQKDIIEYLAQCKKYDFTLKDRWGKSALDLIKWSDKYAHEERRRLLEMIQD